MRVVSEWTMLCFSAISEQEIESALSETKNTFCNSTTVADKPANLEQCVKALKIAVNTLAKIKKDGKRALNKDQNIDLKKKILDAYKELTQLQDYSGSDKAQRCLEFARKWGNGVNIPDTIQPQPPPPPPPPQQQQPQPQPQPQSQPQPQPQPESEQQPQPSDRECGQSDNASISSADSDNLPNEFYQATMAPKPGGIHIHDEDDPVENTHGPKETGVNVPRTEVFNGKPSDPSPSDSVNPREQQEKNPGELADCAPRTAHPSIGQENVDSGIVKANERPKRDLLNRHSDAAPSGLNVPFPGIVPIPRPQPIPQDLDLYNDPQHQPFGPGLNVPFPGIVPIPRPQPIPQDLDLYNDPQHQPFGPGIRTSSDPDF
ncbi:MAG: hypothetical protein J3Q66DRAFT_141043 [Benniella sp.]|nr:MAG: hypothetical protein J3Q66DRAFT_141043 [Benniella sp.]